MLFFQGHPVRVRQAVANAVNTAGLDITWQDIPMREQDALRIAFFQTIPIHIHFERLGLTLWRVKGPQNLYPILHSWSREYPSWVSLLSSVPGITILNPNP